MPKVNNIVLVHGGFVDGAGWRGVYDILKKERLQRQHRAESDNLAGGGCERHQVDNRVPTRPRDPSRALLRRRRHHRGWD